jgi:hypothetical protein
MRVYVVRKGARHKNFLVREMEMEEERKEEKKEEEKKKRRERERKEKIEVILERELRKQKEGYTK